MIEPVTMGPTWQRGEDGEFVLPELSLGYYLSSVWAPRWINQPDGPDAGKSWHFTKEQARFLAWWYAVDEHGVFLYRSGVYRRMKGAGKNPFAVAIALCEFLGPCRFSGKFGPDGQPIGEPHYASWVQMTAVSRDQTRNSTGLLVPMISQDAKREFDIDIGIDETYANGKRCRLQAVTSSPATVEGGRATFIIMDETHHWKGNNEGHAMAEVIARNAAKSRDGSSRALAITNAHIPGQDSVGERDYEAWKLIDARLSDVSDFLYDSVEAPVGIDLNDDDSLQSGLEAARGNADWLNIPRLMAEIRDPRTAPEIARRFYLNQIVAEEDKPFDKVRFIELERPGYTVPDKAAITLGFDGSISKDHTALIGTEVETGYQWVAGYWEPVLQQNGEMEIPFAEVDQTVDEVFRRWSVWRMYVDPSHWRDYMAKWEGRHGTERIVHWATTAYRKMATSLIAYRDAMQLGELSHDGDPRFVAAIGNAYKHMMQFRDDDGEPMWIIQKERPDSPLKIDAAMAGDLSWAARTDAVAAGVRSRTAAVDPDYNRNDTTKPELAGVRSKNF